MIETIKNFGTMEWTIIVMLLLFISTSGYFALLVHIEDRKLKQHLNSNEKEKKEKKIKEYEHAIKAYEEEVSYTDGKEREILLRIISRFKEELEELKK